MVKIQAPLINFKPRLLAGSDLEELFAVFGLLHPQFIFTESANTAEEKPNQMHRVLPFDLAMRAQILFELSELASHVAVIGLVNQLRKKPPPFGQEFLRERSRML